jgi:hypothetical protein
LGKPDEAPGSNKNLRDDLVGVKYVVTPSSAPPSRKVRAPTDLMVWYGEGPGQLTLCHFGVESADRVGSLDNRGGDLPPLPTHGRTQGPDAKVVSNYDCNHVLAFHFEQASERARRLKKKTI